MLSLFYFFFPCTHTWLGQVPCSSGTVGHCDQQASMLMGISSCLITAAPNIYIYILNPYILAESSIFYLLSFIFVIFLFSFYYCFKDKMLMLVFWRLYNSTAKMFEVQREMFSKRSEIYRSSDPFSTIIYIQLY